MTREDRLKQCKFYKGEKDCPEELIKKRFGYSFWIAEKLFTIEEFNRLRGEKEWARTAGLYQYKAKWDGQVNDEVVLYLFGISSKYNGFDPDGTQWFIEHILHAYISSTSTS